MIAPSRLRRWSDEHLLIALAGAIEHGDAPILERLIAEAERRGW